MNELENVSRVRPKRELKGWFTLIDLIVVVSITGVSWLVRGMVYPTCEVPFVVFTAINGVWLLKPPKENPNQKNYTLLWLVLRRYVSHERGYYRSLDAREYAGKERVLCD